MKPALALIMPLLMTTSLALADAEAPSYEDAMEDNSMLEQSLGEAQPLEDYGTLSDAMDEMSLQNGDVVSAPSAETLPLEDEMPEEPSYEDYE